MVTPTLIIWNELMHCSSICSSLFMPPRFHYAMLLVHFTEGYQPNRSHKGHSKTETEKVVEEPSYAVIADVVNKDRNEKGYSGNENVDANAV